MKVTMPFFAPNDATGIWRWRVRLQCVRQHPGTRQRQVVLWGGGRIPRGRFVGRGSIRNGPLLPHQLYGFLGKRRACSRPDPLGGSRFQRWNQLRHDLRVRRRQYLGDVRFQVIQWKAGDDFPEQETPYQIFRHVTFNSVNNPNGAYFQIGEIQFSVSWRPSLRATSMATVSSIWMISRYHATSISHFRLPSVFPRGQQPRWQRRFEGLHRFPRGLCRRRRSCCRSGTRNSRVAWARLHGTSHGFSASEWTFLILNLSK